MAARIRKEGSTYITSDYSESDYVRDLCEELARDEKSGSNSFYRLAISACASQAANQSE